MPIKNLKVAICKAKTDPNGNVGLYALAIHSVRHTTVSWDTLSKVLDVERALEPRGEESSEGCNEGREASHD